MNRWQRFLKYLEPLITERNQITHEREISKGAIMGWTSFIFDLGIVTYIVRHSKNVPHADLVFNFMEIVTVIAVGYMVTHKMILLKSPFQAGGNGNGGNGNGTNGTTKEGV